MRFALILLALVSAAARTALATDAMGVEFYKFMIQFGKNYSSETELAQRFNIFKDNVRTIMTHNAQDKPYKLGINQFSDMTLEEFSRKMNTYGRSSTPTMELITEIAPIPSSINLPSSVDWISRGAVTPIKNQGQCGSCWSFSTTGALEGAYFLKHGNLLSFSEQQLVSCSTNDGGCGGGFVGPAYDFIKSNGGICSEADYPYTSGSTQQSGSCIRNCRPVADVSGYYRVSPNNEVALANAVAQQPISTLICATSAVFQNYKSGVINDASCGTCQDHAVLIVGYGTDAATGLDYWLIKNSWDTWWGDNGYVRVLKTSSTSSIGTCAVSGRSVYPYAV